MRSLIGNRSSEKDIRDWLCKQGFSGNTAKFGEVELHAIMRPGWLQIFRFEVTVLTAAGEKTKLFGAMRSDERYGKPKIIVSAEFADRDEQLDEWAEGLITQRRRAKR